MSVSLVKENKDGFTLQLNFSYSKSMLQGEKDILDIITDVSQNALQNHTGEILLLRGEILKFNFAAVLFLMADPYDLSFFCLDNKNITKVGYD